MKRCQTQHSSKTKEQTSAGGVVFKKTDKGIETTLIAVNNKTRWCIPKGLINEGESAETAALREVREETGLSGEIIGKIGDISYWYVLRDENTKFHKTVHFYLLKYKDGTLDKHDSEVEEAQWFPIEEALKKVTYKGEREILQKAKEMIEK